MVYFSTSGSIDLFRYGFENGGELVYYLVKRSFDIRHVCKKQIGRTIGDDGIVVVRENEATIVGEDKRALVLKRCKGFKLGPCHHLPIEVPCRDDAKIHKN